MSEDSIRADVHNAIADAIRNHETLMLGPWVLAAQTTSEDGQREVWVLTGPDTMNYEGKGLLAEATDRIREDSLDHSWFVADDDDEPEQ